MIYILTTLEEGCFYHYLSTKSTQKEAEQDLIKQYFKDIDPTYQEDDEIPEDMKHLGAWIDGYISFYQIDNNNRIHKIQ